MAGNAIPQFTKNGKITSVLATAANTSSSGSGTIGTDMFLVATADATNGTFIEFVRLMAVATTPTSTTATVGRLFVSTQSSGATTSANTYLVYEISLPSLSADSATIGNNSYDIPLNLRLPPGASLLFSTHAAPAANTNWRATAVGGDY